MATPSILKDHLSRPFTHAVTTVYSDGREKDHFARSIAAAKNFAVGERRKIGKQVIDRKTGDSSVVIDVVISKLV